MSCEPCKRLRNLEEFFWNVDCFIKSLNNLLNLKYRKPPRQEADTKRCKKCTHNYFKKPLRLDHLKDRHGGNKQIDSFTDGITGSTLS